MARENALDEELRKFDPFVHAATTINSYLRVTHDGLSFRRIATVPDILNGAWLDVMIRTPGPETYVFVDRAIMAATAAPGVVALYEGSTFSDPGTVVPFGNANRRSPNLLSDSIASEQPTITDDGELLGSWLIPSSGGQGSNKAGASEGITNDELLLRPNDVYLFRYLNQSGGTVAISYSLRIHEVPEDY